MNSLAMQVRYRLSGRGCAWVFRAALVVAVSACGAHGGTNEWANPLGGDLLESTNWNPVGVPFTNDVAIFRPLSQTNTFAVSTVSDLAMGSVVVDGASIELQLSGYTLAVDGGILVTNGGGAMLRSGLLSSSELGIVGASAGLAGGAAIDVAGYPGDGGLVMHDRGLLSVVDGGGSLTGRVLWAVMGADEVARIRVEGEGTLFRPHDPMGPMGHSGAFLEVGANPNPGMNPYYDALGTAVVELAGGAAIDGTVILYDRGVLRFVDGGGQVTGGLTMTGGTVHVEGGSLVELGYMDSSPGSDFWIDPNGRARFSGQVTGSADFRGGGAVEFLGGFSPGNSPAAVSFEGNVLLGSNNILTLELGGLVAGSEHDQLMVDGNLAFGGTMEVSLIDLFDPAAGDAFRLFQFGSSSNTFASISLPALDGGLAWDTTRLYSEGWLSVLAIPEPRPIIVAIGLLIGVWGLRRTRRS
ncbi:MAG: hypothetical protein IT577_08115 [Verrucomicrobiae bacterium]|nr:hypothetical protein [Verrucomicrobiae bacterium]